MSQKIQIRRGTTTQRMAVTPDVGELMYDITAKALYIGDGSTVGGSLVNTSFARGSVAIGSGVDLIAVSGLSLAGAPTIVLVTVAKDNSADDNLFACVDASSVTAAGFTAHLSALTPNSNYVLKYLCLV